MSVYPRPDTPPTESPAPPNHDDSPGVPGFRIWRGVYIFVFVVFVAVVIALTWFSRHFA
jgi:hypothetical protein